MAIPEAQWCAFRQVHGPKLTISGGHRIQGPGFQNIGWNRNISNITHFKTLPGCRPFLEPRKISLNRKITEIFQKTVSWTLSGNLPFLAPILNLWSKTTQPCSQVSKTLVGTETFPTELISRHYHDVDHFLNQEK